MTTKEIKEYSLDMTKEVTTHIQKDLNLNPNEMCNIIGTTGLYLVRVVIDNFCLTIPLLEEAKKDIFNFIETAVKERTEELKIDVKH